MSSFVNTDLKNMTYKTKNLIQLSNSYSSFAGTKENDSKTKFILVLDGKEKEEIKKQEEKEIKDTSLWTKIKNLFE